MIVVWEQKELRANNFDHLLFESKWSVRKRGNISVELYRTCIRLVTVYSDNVAISSGSYGLRGGFSWFSPPEAWRVTRRDGPARAWAWPQSWPKPGLHPFLVRTDKPGYLSAATSIQPIASRTWARFFFLYIFYFLVSCYEPMFDISLINPLFAHELFTINIFKSINNKSMSYWNQNNNLNALIIILLLL